MGKRKRERRTRVKDSEEYMKGKREVRVERGSKERNNEKIEKGEKYHNRSEGRRDKRKK